MYAEFVYISFCENIAHIYNTYRMYAKLLYIVCMQNCTFIVSREYSSYIVYIHFVLQEYSSCTLYCSYISYIYEIAYTSYQEYSSCILYRSYISYIYEIAYTSYYKNIAHAYYTAHIYRIYTKSHTLRITRI